MQGMAWLEVEDMADFLRVGEESYAILEALGRAVPDFVEATTGYDASLVAGECPSQTVRQLARFLIQLWHCPDGTDARQLRQAVHSLTCVVKAQQAAGA